MPHQPINVTISLISLNARAARARAIPEALASEEAASTKHPRIVGLVRQSDQKHSSHLFRRWQGINWKRERHGQADQVYTITCRYAWILLQPLHQTFQQSRRTIEHVESDVGC